jgi:DNA-binding SARP family transcriptional activator/tetratricopeptide (TPR) repeat protein
MRFEVLGSMRVMTGDRGEPGSVSAPRLRVLLAALLWQANRPVPANELAELVWDGTPPAGAPEAVRALMMRLRRRLDPEAAARIVTRAPGYMIEVSGDELDASRFETLTRQAGAAVRAEQWARAARTATEALGLWRGTPLADIPSQLLRDRWVPHLDELRMQALGWRIEGDLHDGRHEQLIPELRDLVAHHPLQEHFHSHLMLALYRCGRQAEALDAYRCARDILVTEVGVEPGPGLQDMHQRILSADPALVVTGAARPADAEPEQGAPRELPSAVPGFTGRSAELEALGRLLDRSGEQVPGTVVISAIGGTAGIGKTALAVHWAQQVAGRFPDGQLYVNLRGYDPDQPMTPTYALATFLRSLGVPGQEIPPEANERAALFRSLLAGKRMLILLDNAGSADQVRPLLPGTADCAVLVTSRDALAGLVARDGATRLNLDSLPLHDAVALLRTLIGTRVDAEPAAADELADQCCRLPLALRVAAELAASRPAVPLATLTGDLADLRHRLDLLEVGGDPYAQVRTVFSWSYRRLDADTARTFRLLGLHPGPDLETYAAAALTGATVQQAGHALDLLARAHLTQPAGPGRYGMHDLLRGYARELAVAEDKEHDRKAALTGLFDHYLQTATVATGILSPSVDAHPPRMAPSATPVHPLDDPSAAREWLDRERATLVACTRYAAAHDWPGHATRLAGTLSHYLRSGGYLPEAIAIFGYALDAARRTGDRSAEASALTDIGYVDWWQNRLQEAADRHRQALDLFREAGDRAGEAKALRSIGLDETQLGRYEQAADHQQEALTISRDISDPHGEALALGNLGLARQLQGRYQEAADYLQQSLDLIRKIGDRSSEGVALARLGFVDLRLGRYPHAVGYLEQALGRFRETGSTIDESQALGMLGEAYAKLERYEQAIRSFEQALAICRLMHDPVIEAEALNGLAGVLSRTGDTGEARAHYATALRIASEIGSPREQARAHSGLASSYNAGGDSRQARYHWQEALTRYTAIGAPEADEIRAHLAMAGESS